MVDVKFAGGQEGMDRGQEHFVATSNGGRGFNEDAVFFAVRKGLGAVLSVDDGAGGANAGEVASGACADEVEARVDRLLEKPVRGRLRAAQIGAHRRLCAAKPYDLQRRAQTRAASAFSVGVVKPDEAVLGHDADIRWGVFDLDKKDWIYVSIDHNLAVGQQLPMKVYAGDPKKEFERFRAAVRQKHDIQANSSFWTYLEKNWHRLKNWQRCELASMLLHRDNAISSYVGNNSVGRNPAFDTIKRFDLAKSYTTPFGPKRKQPPHLETRRIAINGRQVVLGLCDGATGVSAMWEYGDALTRYPGDPMRGLQEQWHAIETRQQAASVGGTIQVKIAPDPGAVLNLVEPSPDNITALGYWQQAV